MVLIKATKAEAQLWLEWWKTSKLLLDARHGQARGGFWIHSKNGFL